MRRFWGNGRLVVRLVAIAAMLSVLALARAYAETRLALVIGNSNYVEAPLKNPENDATLMAKSLRQLGFQVFDHINLDQKEMKRAVRDFGRELELAGREAVGLIYYAGHGVQVNGTNYLIPVDAKIRHELDVDIEAVSASALVQTLGFAGNRLNMVIFDACRNNPYKRSFRAANNGLAKMDAPQGTLLAYSTAPGQTADDGSGKYSPYTQALVRSMNQPGMPVEQVFKSVRIKVMERTSGQQVPWESSSLTGEFYFSGDRGAAPVAKGPQPSAGEVEASGQASVEEMLFWQSVQSLDTEDLYRAYLDQYPNGRFAPIARAQVALFEAEADVDVAAQPKAPEPAPVPPAPAPAPKPVVETPAPAPAPTSAPAPAPAEPEVAALTPAARIASGRVSWRIKTVGKGGGAGVLEAKLCRHGYEAEFDFDTKEGRGRFVSRERIYNTISVQITGTRMKGKSKVYEFNGALVGDRIEGRFIKLLGSTTCKGVFEMEMVSGGQG